MNQLFGLQHRRSENGSTLTKGQKYKKKAEPPKVPLFYYNLSKFSFILTYSQT